LQVDWREKRKLLKLVMPFRAVPKKRIDGIPGGWLERPLDGREMPMRDGVVIEMGEPPIGIVAPDVYGVDATPERIRFTLLRSPLMAHHIPHRTDIARPVYTDQGPHTFVFRFFRDPRVNTEFVEREATQLHRPPIIADLTRGMPCRLADPEADDE
jgi:alpha-mannosidase